MTENAFYPLFLVVALLLVLTLEGRRRRGRSRCSSLRGRLRDSRAGGCALRCRGDRADAARADRAARARATLRRFGWLYGASRRRRGVVALARDRGAGRSPLTLLGAYRAATSSSTPSAASCTTSSTTSPSSTSTSASSRSPRCSRSGSPLAARAGGARAFAAASLAIAAWLLPRWPSSPRQSFVDRIEERNVFYLAPLALIALSGWPSTAASRGGGASSWGRGHRRGSFRSSSPTSASSTPARSRTPSRSAVVVGAGQPDPPRTVRWAALVVCLAAAAVFAFLPRRFALVLPGARRRLVRGTSFVVENGLHGIHGPSVESLSAGRT